MKRFLCAFFGSLGVIFFVLLLLVGYLFVSDAYGIRTLLTASRVVPASTGGSPTTPSSQEQGAADQNPILSPAQEQALEAVGVDPAQVPSKFTPEQEACFVGILGAARVEEIKKGATPSATEFFRAKECMK